MTEGTHPSGSARAFLSDVERLLAPVYAECFSDETRKNRNSLLVISFVLTLSALGLIAVGREPINKRSLNIFGLVHSRRGEYLACVAGTHGFLEYVKEQGPSPLDKHDKVMEEGACLVTVPLRPTFTIDSEFVEDSKLNKLVIPIRMMPK